MLINTFFVGQLEFKALIARNENRAVRQRITVSYELAPLTADETPQYIGHRLKVGGASRPIFTPEAIRLIHSYSKGYPRLINIICDHALMSGYSRGVDRIDEKIIKECGRELKVAIGSDPSEEKAMPPATPPKKESAAGLAPAPSADQSHPWRGALVFAGFLALLGSTWYFAGDRISDELARWGKGKELATLQGQKAPAPTDEKPDRVPPLASDSGVKPKLQEVPAAKPSQEGLTKTKKETPAVTSSAASPPQAAPAVAPTAPAPVDSPAAAKTETVAAVPMTPPLCFEASARRAPSTRSPPPGGGSCTPSARCGQAPIDRKCPAERICGVFHTKFDRDSDLRQRHSLEHGKFAKKLSRDPGSHRGAYRFNRRPRIKQGYFCRKSRFSAKLSGRAGY